MVIEWLEWGAYELSIESLSRTDWLGGCGAICRNDVPFKSVLSHCCYKIPTFPLVYTSIGKGKCWNLVKFVFLIFGMTGVSLMSGVFIGSKLQFVFE